MFTMLPIGMHIENHTLLVSGDELDWDTKMKDILPEWRLMDQYASDHADVTDLLGGPHHLTKS